MRVYKGKMDARNGGTFLYIFLSISPRKINISKNSKLGLRELNELDDMNAKKNITQFNQYFETYYINAQKNEKK